MYEFNNNIFNTFNHQVINVIKEFEEYDYNNFEKKLNLKQNINETKIKDNEQEPIKLNNKNEVDTYT